MGIFSCAVFFIPNLSFFLYPVETIDLYYAHVDDRGTEFDEVLEAFTRLINSGKVRFIGASNIPTWRLEQAHWVSKMKNLAEYCCAQQRHTYLQPRSGTKFENQVVANDDLLGYCKTRGLTLLAYSPLLKGAYVRADRPFYSQYQGTDNEKRLAMLKVIADETGATITQVVLAWMLHSNPQVLPVFSASTKEQLKENLESLQIKLRADQFNRLQNIEIN